MSDRLCVVMPVYNERDAIKSVLEKWSAELDRIGVDYVIRPYNDGSKDDSLEVMMRVAANLPHVEVRDKPNGGHGPTILQGYREAARDGFDWVFQIDSDDEMSPESFVWLWSMRKDYDFLVGRREGRKQSLSRRIISFVSRIVVSCFYGKGGVWDVNTPYRLMRVSEFADCFESIPYSTFAPNVMLSGLAAKRKLRCVELPVPQRDRQTGEVSIRKWRLLSAAVKSFYQVLKFPILNKKWTISDIIPAFSIGIGLISAVWFCLSWQRVVTALMLAVAMLALMRIVVVRVFMIHLCDTISNHPWRSFLVVIGCGAIFRSVIFLLLPELHHLYTDYATIWDCSSNVLNGRMTLSKSWTTVVFWACAKSFFVVDLIGAHICVFLLQGMTALLMFLFLRKYLTVVSAIVGIVLYFFSMYVVFQSANVTATEHTYAFCVVFSLLVTASLMSTSGVCINSFIRVSLLGILMWMAVWARAEGIILWILCPFWLLGYLVLNKRRYVLAGELFIILIAVFVFGAFFAIRLNERINDGARTVFCSNDSCWPRLFGANVSSNGTAAKEDFNLIASLYLKDHPEAKFTMCDAKAHCHDSYPLEFHVNCPEYVREYVQAETRRRWREMDLWTLGGFIWTKERVDWCMDFYFYLDYLFQRSKSDKDWRYYLAELMTFPLPALVASLGLFSTVMLLFMLASGTLDERLIPVMIVFPFVFCNMAILSFTEAQQRYGYVGFMVLWPMIAAVPVSVFHRSSIES